MLRVLSLLTLLCSAKYVYSQDGTRTLLNDLPIPSFASLIALLGKDPNSGRSNDPLPKCPAGIKETLAGFHNDLSDLSCTEDSGTEVDTCQGDQGKIFSSSSTSEIVRYRRNYDLEFRTNFPLYNIHYCCWACRLTQECGSWTHIRYGGGIDECILTGKAFKFNEGPCRSCYSKVERTF